MLYLITAYRNTNEPTLNALRTNGNNCFRVGHCSIRNVQKLIYLSIDSTFPDIL